MHIHYTCIDLRKCKTVELFFFLFFSRMKKKKKGNLYLTFLHPWQLPGNQSCPTCATGVPPVTSLLKLQSLFLLHLSLWLTIYSHFYQVGDWFLSSNDEILIKTEEAPIQHHQSRLIWTKIGYTYKNRILPRSLGVWTVLSAFSLL